jgi:hypothetical protein
MATAVSMKMLVSLPLSFSLCLTLGAACSTPNPAAALNNQVITVPCPGTPNNGEECSFPAAQHKVDRPFTIAGDPNVTYKVTLKLCGVWEGMKYAGCVPPDPAAPAPSNVCIGGTRSNEGNDADYPTLALDVAAPARTYYLNRESDILDKIFKFDYTASFEMKGGTTVSLRTDGGGNDGHYTASGPGGPHSCDTNPPGIKQPYFGQFVHLQVVSAVPLP